METKRESTSMSPRARQLPATFQLLCNSFDQSRPSTLPGNNVRLSRTRAVAAHFLPAQASSFKHNTAEGTTRVFGILSLCWCYLGPYTQARRIDTDWLRVPIGCAVVDRHMFFPR